MKKLIFACAALVLAMNASARGDADNGRELATKKYACISCHGEGLNKPIDPSYPKLAGQHYDYLVHALTAYQHSDNPETGRVNAIMNGQAKPLSKQDILDIAAYASGLPSDLLIKK